MNMFEDLVFFSFSFLVSSGEHVCVIISEQKLHRKLQEIKANSNKPLLVKENGLEPNDFIDLSHERLFHPKNGETSFN